MKNRLKIKTNKLKLTTLGFTLIELLAIIVLLVVVAVITVPIVSNLIDKSKQSAAIDSAHGIKRALDEYYTSYDLLGDVFKGYTCEFPNNCDKVQISGDVPSSGSIVMDKNGIINGNIVFDDKYYFVFENDEIRQVEFIDFYLLYTQELVDSAISYGKKNGGSCSYDFYTNTNKCFGLTINNKPVGGKITISNGLVNGIIKYNDEHLYEIINNNISLIDKNRDSFVVYLDFEDGFNNIASKWDISYDTSITYPKKASIDSNVKYSGNNSAYFEGPYNQFGNELSVAGSSDFEIGNVYTFDLFYNPSISNTSTNYNFIQKGYYTSGINGGFTFRYDRYSNMINFIITNGTSILFELNYSKALQNNTWYRLTVTSDGTTVRMFIDGVLVASKANSYGITAIGRNLTIGGRDVNPATYGANASGYLDDVYINIGECLYISDF